MAQPARRESTPTFAGRRNPRARRANKPKQWHSASTCRAPRRRPKLRRTAKCCARRAANPNNNLFEGETRARRAANISNHLLAIEPTRIHGATRTPRRPPNFAGGRTSAPEGLQISKRTRSPGTTRAPRRRPKLRRTAKCCARRAANIKNNPPPMHNQHAAQAPKLRRTGNSAPEGKYFQMSTLIIKEKE